MGKDSQGPEYLESGRREGMGHGWPCPCGPRSVASGEECSLIHLDLLMKARGGDRAISAGYLAMPNVWWLSQAKSVGVATVIHLVKTKGAVYHPTVHRTINAVTAEHVL